MKYNLFTASKIALPLILFSSQTQLAFAADKVKLANDGGLELSITANRRLQNVARLPALLIRKPLKLLMRAI